MEYVIAGPPCARRRSNSAGAVHAMGCRVTRMVTGIVRSSGELVDRDGAVIGAVGHLRWRLDVDHVRRVEADGARLVDHDGEPRAAILGGGGEPGARARKAERTVAGKDGGVEGTPGAMVRSMDEGSDVPMRTVPVTTCGESIARESETVTAAVQVPCPRRAVLSWNWSAMTAPGALTVAVNQVAGGSTVRVSERAPSPMFEALRVCAGPSTPGGRSRGRLRCSTSAAWGRRQHRPPATPGGIRLSRY